jgi:hypothetical protein
MKKFLVTVVALGCVVGALASFAAPGDDEVQIASLVQEMEGMSPAQLAALEPIEVQPYTLPPAGVDVMRARLSETYEIDGVGRDTVELTGWIAVRRDDPRLAPDETEMAWGKTIIDTQFIALELHGHSNLFGDVNITLDKERPAYGQVGKIDIPEKARTVLASLAEENGIDTSLDNEACVAPTNVAVSLPDLGIEMKTAEPAVWNSLVKTIPPTGQQASVTTEPVTMVAADGRKVGTLLSGRIAFREVVRQVELTDGRVWTTVADAQ